MTFEKEIRFIHRSLVNTNWVKEETPKMATFEELDRTNQDQAKLQGKILSLYQSQQIDEDNEKGTFRLDTDALYDISIKCIKKLLIVDQTFTETDKKEFLADNIAVYRFGLWFLENHLGPFSKQLAQT